MKRATRKKTVALHHVTLEEFAGVRAALEEGIELADVLAQESIEAAVWPKADQAWTEAIADSPALGIELVQTTAVAEDCLGGTIEPLQDDPAAWVGFMTQLATASDPDGVLEGHGLTTSDMGRLGRLWKRKGESDPKLVKQLEELAPKAKPPARVKVAPTLLRPFPWTVRKPPPPERRESAAPDTREELRVEGPAAAPKQLLATYQLLELQNQHQLKQENRAVPSEERADATDAMPMPEVLRQRIQAAEPRAAMAEAARRMPPQPVEATPSAEGEEVGGATEAAPPSAVIAARVKHALPFRRPSTPAAHDGPGGDTAALPPPEVIARRAAEAEPRVAMARAAIAGAAQSKAPSAAADPNAFPEDSESEEPGTGTAFMPNPTIAAIRQNASFAERLTPMRVPNLSLAQYAAFRAALTTRGENDVATWREFGVQSAAGRDALRSMFAERFEHDPQERDEFLRLVREATRAQHRGR